MSGGKLYGLVFRQLEQIAVQRSVRYYRLEATGKGGRPMQLALGLNQVLGYRLFRDAEVGGDLRPVLAGSPHGCDLLASAVGTFLPFVALRRPRRPVLTSAPSMESCSSS
jgi:hypothetical protein